MFRLWVRLVDDNHLIKDMVVCDESTDTRTHKVMNAIEKACYEMDLSKPIIQRCIFLWKRMSQTVVTNI